MIKEFIQNRKKILVALLTAISLLIILNISLSSAGKIRYIFPYIKTGYTVLILTIFIIYITSIFEKLKIISRIIKVTAITSVVLSIVVFFLLLLWYDYCFFPDDEKYLKKKVDETVYTDNDLYEVELDLIRNLDKAAISSPLSKADREYLLNPQLKGKDIYIDYNPYNSVSQNNLKYATGRTFYYVYQKNCAVIKANSLIEFKLPASGKRRFVELDAVFPAIEGDMKGDGEFAVYFKHGNGKLESLTMEKIQKEVKPDIEPFRYSNFLSSVWFYLRHPGRSVLTDNTGWKKIKADIPQSAGTLVLEFKTQSSGKNYLFAGTPRVYGVKERERERHYNLVYIIFDIFGQPHADIYEYYDEFMKNGFNDAMNIIGKKNILTENIDSYFDRIVLFDNVMTTGQVTRPAITSLWTSQFFTKARMPVFRNVVTLDNQKEFYDQGFTTLGEKLSGYGYLTKQIACNAQGHNVSGVGADLGFDENHDYTMETSEYTANIKHIISFLNENQNRKFFLYTHLNIPHPPKWVPGKYFIRELGASDFNFDTARLRANIKYLDFNFKMIMDTIKKLRLDDNTFVVITADHSSGESTGFRDKPGRQLSAIIKKGRESSSIASFHPSAIYVRSGGQHLHSDFMQIPFIVIPPKSFRTQKARIGSFISNLDIAPTFLDLLKGQKEKLFSGTSFRYLLENPEKQKKVHSDYIPLAGRFSLGFILNGKYKYWWDIKGIYKYKEGWAGLKYIQKPEHLFDLENDPYETMNLANDEANYSLLNEMRNLRLTKFQDYDEKNYLQIAPDEKVTGNIKIQVSADKGKIVYASSYGEGIKITQKNEKEIEIVSKNNNKHRFVSFETKPDRIPLKISIFRNNALIEKQQIFTGMEKLNIFSNPFILNDIKDFFIVSVPGRTGLEEIDLPAGSVYYYRIPLIYWLEMSRSEKDINLSPGIKEVLKGWGYIQ
jgi:arylsulfatase A-like enzyme